MHRTVIRYSMSLFTDINVGGPENALRRDVSSTRLVVETPVGLEPADDTHCLLSKEDVPDENGPPGSEGT
jgi:hypothetical protein